MDLLMNVVRWVRGCGIQMPVRSLLIGVLAVSGWECVALSGAGGGQAEAAETLRQLEPGEEPELTPNVVVIDGADTPWLGYWQGEQANADKSVVAVADQPFGQAVRVEVNEAADPAWEVQVLSPNSTATVAAGDQLLVSFWIRAEPVDGHTPEVTAILQTDAGAEYLTIMKPTITGEWSQVEQQVTSEAAHGLDQLAVVFHLGHAPQVIEIANPRVVKLMPASAE